MSRIVQQSLAVRLAILASFVFTLSFVAFLLCWLFWKVVLGLFGVMVPAWWYWQIAGFACVALLLVLEKLRRR